MTGVNDLKLLVGLERTVEFPVVDHIFSVKADDQLVANSLHEVGLNGPLSGLETVFNKVQALSLPYILTNHGESNYLRII